jgi:fido (protein-threonine AMPylation protein)
MFKDVHPWAGQFRQPGETVTTAWGAEGAHPERIRDLLAMAETMSAKAFARATAEDKLHAAALWHCEVMKIHPFRDGNTRVSWLISEAQVRQSFGERTWAHIDRQQYVEALRTADERLDFAPFTTMIRSAIEHLQLAKDDLQKLNAQEVKHLLDAQELKAVNGIERSALTKTFQETTLLSGEESAAKAVMEQIERAPQQDQRFAQSVESLLDQSQEQDLDQDISHER